VNVNNGSKQRNTSTLKLLQCGMKEHKRQIQTYSSTKMVAIVKKVCENYSLGDYNLDVVCENAGVPYRTFRHWWSMYEKEGSIDGSKWAALAEVADEWQASQNERVKSREKELVENSLQSLLKRISGYYYETTETIVRMEKDRDGNDVIVPIAIKKIKKYMHPSDKLIIFILTKLRPEQYGDQNFVQNTIPKNPYLDYTLEEIEAEIEKVQRKLEIIEPDEKKLITTKI